MSESYFFLTNLKICYAKFVHPIAKLHNNSPIENALIEERPLKKVSKLYYRFEPKKKL